MPAMPAMPAMPSRVSCRETPTSDGDEGVTGVRDLLWRSPSRGMAVKRHESSSSSSSSSILECNTKAAARACLCTCHREQHFGPIPVVLAFGIGTRSVLHFGCGAVVRVPRPTLGMTAVYGKCAFLELQPCRSKVEAPSTTPATFRLNCQTRFSQARQRHPPPFIAFVITVVSIPTQIDLHPR
ncbi:hypothetical protein L1887_62671 [Cichorium endivia]|nr:hypothetical protein L1887_62671 [Cichorium endivia]